MIPVTRLLLCLASLAAAGMATAAQAQTGVRVDKDMGVSGNAPNLCILGELSQSNVLPLVNASTLGVGAVEILELRDEVTLSTAAASFSITFQGMCNYPHRLTIESANNGLFRAISANDNVSGFGTAVPYTASMNWGGERVSFEADALRRGITNQTSQVTEPFAGDLQLSVQIRAGATNLRDGAPLVGGLFSDVLRITVEPQ